MWSRALVAAIAFALLGAAAAPAAFPGRDGRVAVVVRVVCDEYAPDSDPCYTNAFTEAVAAAPSGRGWRAIARWPCPLCLIGGVFSGPVVYSPDGRRLALQGSVPAEWPATPPSALEILASDGSTAVRVAVPGFFGHPSSWLPDGRHVAVFAPGELSTSGRVFVVGVDDASVREVKTGPRGERTWSSTGAVAISHPRGIYVWSRGTGRRLALAATDRATYTDPDWSPDGRRIVALRTDLKTRLETIITATANGRDRRIVVRGPAPGCHLGPPAWSPSGTRIAFTAFCLDPRSAANALFTVRTNGEGLRTVFEADPLIPKTGSFVAGVGPDVSWQPLTG